MVIFAKIAKSYTGAINIVPSTHWQYDKTVENDDYVKVVEVPLEIIANYTIRNKGTKDEWIDKWYWFQYKEGEEQVNFGLDECDMNDLATRVSSLGFDEDKVIKVDERTYNWLKGLEHRLMN